MTYSASLVSCLFWYTETRNTVPLLQEGKTVQQIREIAVQQTLYQVRAEDREKRIAGVICKRLAPLTPELLKALASSDSQTGKLVNLVAVIKSDQLFYEFMHDVFMHSVIIGEKNLPVKEITVFFDNKIAQSAEVAAFSASAVAKLKQTYVKFLIEAGIVNNASEKTLNVPFVDHKLEQLFRAAKLLPYVSVITGQNYEE